ncbi:MAG: hypothetical protein ACOCRK_06465 [bacterium]
MIKITFLDDFSVTGETFDEIAKSVKKKDASLPKSIEEYMHTVDTRYDIVNIDLDTSSARAFFKDLEEKGFVKIEKIREAK